MNIEALSKELKRDEGYSDVAYKDSEGHLTIGYGTKITKIDEGLAEVMLIYMIKQKVVDLENRRPIVKNFPQEVQLVLGNLAYQLGVTGLLKFVNMWDALYIGDYSNAAKELIDSKLFRQMHEADMRDGIDSVNRTERLAIRLEKLSTESISKKISKKL